MHNPKMVVGFVIGLVVLLVGGIFLMSRPQAGLDGKNYDQFAQCLTDKKLTMYGAYWCPHCQNEKKALGTSAQYIPYVECTQQTKLCLEKGIESYPTWIAEDGTKYVGEQGLQKLSELSACVLPE